MKIINNLVFAFLLTSIFSLSTITAQNDTMYIMKQGNVLGKFKVSEIDSVIFYKPSISTTVTDIDGNVYTTVTIGTQVWMAENMKTTRYADGTAIPLVNNATSWNALTSTDKAYCWYDDNIANKENCGALYTWYAALGDIPYDQYGAQGVCPTGWHVPSDAEWTTMTDYLIANGYNYDGTTTGNKIAKALAATTNWSSSSSAGVPGNTDYPSYRNKTGFTALPVGYRSTDGVFYSNGDHTVWWSVTPVFTTGAWAWSVSSDYTNIGRSGSDTEAGYSVRCVRD